MLCFHGGGGSPRSIERQSGFSRLSEREGFLVVYPKALAGNWNDGRDSQKIWCQANEIDDVAFVQSLLERLKSRFDIDEKRIYAAGFSNGAMFCLRLARELPLAFAAVASVAGGMAESVSSAFSLDFPVSLLMIHGSKDPIVPYRGGGVGFHHNRGRVVDTHRCVRMWVKANACNDDPQISYLRDGRHDETKTKVFRFADGRASSEVILYTVIGAGHVWPGRRLGPRWRRMVGPVCLDFDAGEVIWSFFLTHPRKTAIRKKKG